MKIIKRLAKDNIMFVLGLMLCCYTESYSQYEQKISAVKEVEKNEIPRHSLTPKAGINPVRISLTDGSDKKDGLEFHIGLTWEKRLKDSLSINVGLIFSNITGKYTYNYLTTVLGDTLNVLPKIPVKSEYSYNALYLDIPVDLRYYIYGKNTFRAFLNVGVYARMILFGTATQKYIYDPANAHRIYPQFKTSETTFVSFSQTGENMVPIIDLGVSMGAGVEDRNISLSINNQIGVGNYILQISLGYRFGIGKQK